MLNRRSFSDVLPESPKSARKKEEARQAEFVRIGQVKIHTNSMFCTQNGLKDNKINMRVVIPTCTKIKVKAKSAKQKRVYRTVLAKSE